MRVALLGLGFVVLAGFVASLDLAAIVSAVSGADAGWLTLALALLVVNVMAKALRWRAMAATMGPPPPNLPAASSATPSSAAGGGLPPWPGGAVAKPLLFRRTPRVPSAASPTA